MLQWRPHSGSRGGAPSCREAGIDSAADWADARRWRWSPRFRYRRWCCGCQDGAIHRAGGHCFHGFGQCPVDPGEASCASRSLEAMIIADTDCAQLPSTAGNPDRILEPSRWAGFEIAQAQWLKFFFSVHCDNSVHRLLPGFACPVPRWPPSRPRPRVSNMASATMPMPSTRWSQLSASFSGT